MTRDTQTTPDSDNYAIRSSDDISMEAANKIVDVFNLRMVDVLLINQIIYKALEEQHNKTCGEFR